jgi:hypothetical protein
MTMGALSVSRAVQASLGDVQRLRPAAPSGGDTDARPAQYHHLAGGPEAYDKQARHQGTAS